MKMVIATVIGLLMAPSAMAGVIIDFEGFAPDDGLINVNPDEPYMEDGYTLTPFDASSAVFGALGPADMPGNEDSAFLGFGPANAITITNDAGLAFNLHELLLGPNSFGTPPMNVTLVGNLEGGGSVMETFFDLDTATLASLDWSGLTSVVITATTDAAIDNIALSVPSPAALGLFGVAAFAGRRRRR